VKKKSEHGSCVDRTPTDTKDKMWKEWASIKSRGEGEKGKDSNKRVKRKDVR